MRKLAPLFFLLLGLVGNSFGQLPSADDSTVIRSGPTKSWPIGPYSTLATNYGVVTTSIPLVNVKGKGLTSLELSLVHRSINNGIAMTTFPAGFGWAHTGMSQLTVGNLTTQTIAGRAVNTWQLLNGNFYRKPGNRNDIFSVTNGYKVTDYETKVDIYYDRASVSTQSRFLITKKVDTFGNQVTYSYFNGSDKLSRITDASGRYIEFIYDTTKTYRISKIHLQAGGFFREWDLTYPTTSDFLATIVFPVPYSGALRPTIEFDYYGTGEIFVLRSLSRKLWKYVFGTVYSTKRGLVEMDQPDKSNPTSLVDLTNNYTFSYATNNLTNQNGEVTCNIKDAMGKVWQHAYYNSTGVGGQNTTDFPWPIKRVQDPTTTIYSNPRSNQNSTPWVWLESFVWNTGDGTLATYTDREGTPTSYTYDVAAHGLVLTKSMANQGVTYTDSYLYTTDGKVSQYTDPQGTITSYTYDPTTRALTKVALDPSGQNLTKNYHYNSTGQVDEEWIGNDPHTFYSNFDAYGNARTIAPPTASSTFLTFDDFNNKLSMTEPTPKGTTTFAYDFWDRPTRTTYPDAKYVENTYDLDGNVTELRLEDGTRRTMTYNHLNLLRTTSVPVDGNASSNLVTTNDYDFNGRQTSVVSPDGLPTTFLYNERGGLIKATYSDGTNRQAGYNGNGNMVWRQNGRGNLTYYYYDDLNRLYSIDYQTAGMADVTFGYRKDGLRVSRADSLGTSTWTYNNAKQLTSSFDAATNKTLTFTYQTGSGRPLTMVAPGNTWTYYYDANTRPLYTTQTMSGEVTRNSDFWADGTVKTRRAPNNTKAEFSYDTRGRITGVRHAVTSLDLTQEQISYGYTNGNMSLYTLAINNGPSYSTTYTHDLANRLLSEVRSDSTGVNAFAKYYSYTKGNDRIATTKNGTTSGYTYFTNTNRFKTGEGFTVNSYDNDGNPTSIVVPSSGTWTLAYDEESRLTQVTKPGGNNAFKYNGDGQRVERMTPTSTYRYLLNGNNLVLTTTTSYAIQAYYTPGIGYFKGGQMHYYQENGLGSALVIRDSAGNWESFTEYDAFGGEYAVNGTQKSDFRFLGSSGFLKDDDTGMELVGNSRFYLPVLGRYLTQGSFGLWGGFNQYSFSRNSPLMIGKR